MEHGDKIAVYTSYEFMTGINQFVCTMSFYYSPNGSTSYSRLRTTIQYDVPYPSSNLLSTLGINVCKELDQSSGCVFGMSTAAGRFFVVANDGTKAVRFSYNQGVEGMLESIIPIDLDANRLEITDSSGAKTYGKYHQFMPHALTKIGSRYYLNGRMIRTYSNGDQNVMEVYLWSDDGANWSVGDVSFFIDAAYYKKGESVDNYLYSLVYSAGQNTVYAIGSNCYSTAPAREIDKQIEGTDFSEIVIQGEIGTQTNSADSMNLVVMRGFTNIDPSVLGGKTISLELGYYDTLGNVCDVKMGEYFVDSEMHVLSNVGRGPNKVSGSDAGAWKLTRWSSITDIDRWSSTAARDDLKKLSKLIVKGISSDYKAVDNATASGLYLSNLNDPFVGYTSTKDDRDGMFTVCARFTDTGSTVKLSSIGLLIGAEDYTDIYTNGAADRKGWNAYMIPSASTWTGHAQAGPQMRKSNLKRRFDDPGTVADESDVDRAYQWIRRYTSLWRRSVYLADGSADSSWNTITTAAATGGGSVIYSSSFAAQHDVDYEFVVRKQSGRMQLYQRKKGFTSATVSNAAYTDYTLIHEYQFGKDDRINWGPRPYWGFVANTDVFSSLDGWNSREYGNVETTITDAYNNVGTTVQDFINNFPDARLASYGFLDAINGNTLITYNTTTKTEQVWVEREISSGGGYYENNTTTTTTTNSQAFTYDQLYLVQIVGTLNISVGEIVRVFLFEKNAVSPDPIGWTISNTTPGVVTSSFVNFNSGRTNAYGRSEFVGVIESIEDTTQINITPSAKKIRFSKTWGGNLFNRNGQNVYYVMYKVGPSETHAKMTSGSVVSNVLLDTSGTTLPIDIRNGSVKQAGTTAGRAAIVNRQNDAILIRLMDSDGATHLMYDGSGQTKLGFDWPTNPISDPVYPGCLAGLKKDVSTREWRILMYQGRLLPMSSVSFGLPDGKQKSYMIKGTEIVRYQNWGYKERGSDQQVKVWCIIPAYYTPIFPSEKNATFVRQWSVETSPGKWVEPGDNFTVPENISGLRMYINGKWSYSSVDGETKYYAVSADSGGGDASVASTLTFAPALKAGADSVNIEEEKAKDTDKQLKEIAILSGREQFETSSGLQSFSDPLCFYPVGPSTTKVPDSFIKVHYWTMNAGLYNSAKDNLKYVCNLAGVSDVWFMDKAGSVGNNATGTVYASSAADPGLSHFVLEMNASVSHASRMTVTFRDAYKIIVDVDNPTSGNFNGRGLIVLTLQANHSSLPSSGYQTIAKASIPVSDIALTGSHDFRVIARKERVIVEMDGMPVWTFDLKTYTFGGAKNDQSSLFTDARAPVTLAVSGISSGVSYVLVELAEEVENQIIDMSQGGGESVQFITKERHIHTRSTQDGGLQFGKFMDGNRDAPATGASLPTENYIKDQLEYNPFQVPGHVLVTGAEYGEHIDPEWIRQNGYMFNTNQNRLLDTVEDSIKEAKLLIRMMKEDSDNSDVEMIGLPHIQPEDSMTKTYSYPTQEAVSEDQIVSGHSIRFDQSEMKSILKIRKKYSLE